MTRKQLAEAGGLSAGPIKRIETEGHVPKAPTLRLIANGLATYAGGRRDEALADDYYDRLMRAAGYLAGDGEPTGEIRAEDETTIVRRNLEARYGEDAGFVQQVLDHLERAEPPQRSTVLRLLLGGIADALGRAPLAREAQLTR